MASLSTILNKQVNCNYISIGDLRQGEKYPILKFKAVECKFGPVVVVTLDDGDEGRLEAYLPSTVTMTEDHINTYNALAVKNPNILYKGKRGRSFHIKFTE